MAINTEKWKRNAGKVRIGVISDTHGRLSPAVVKHFKGVSHIIHAGDIGVPEVLEELRRIAPVTAVLGNIDAAAQFPGLEPEACGDISGIRFLVAHTQRDVLTKHEDPAQEGYDLVVTGHTHHPFADWHDGVLYLNPGSAGPSRFGSQPSIAVVEVDTVGLDPRIIPLD